MCFRLDSLPPIPAVRGAAISTTTSSSRRPNGPASPRLPALPEAPPCRCGRPPGHSRALPVLRGARASVRGARFRGGRDRYSGSRPARRSGTRSCRMGSVSRRRRRASRPTSRGRRLSPVARRRLMPGGLHASVSASAAATPGCRPPAGGQQLLRDGFLRRGRSPGHDLGHRCPARPCSEIRRRFSA